MWLDQVHGAGVIEGLEAGQQATEADAAATSVAGHVLAVLTADCLPVLLCDTEGRRIGVAHAGWRGLAGGVIEATVSHLQTPPDRIIAWLGPAIGGDLYEVGEDVREAFECSYAPARSNVVESFRPCGERWSLNLAGAARTILLELGIERVYGGGFCTYGDSERFFSYRRDGGTGRMASLIWLDPN